MRPTRVSARSFTLQQADNTRTDMPARRPPAVKPAKPAVKKNRPTATRTDTQVKKAISDTVAERPHRATKRVAGMTKEEREKDTEKRRSKRVLPDVLKPTMWKPGESGNPNGRPPTWASRVSRLTAAERLELARKYGVTPLEFLLSVMSDETEPMTERIDAAKAAAPYMHRKMPIGIDMRSFQQGSGFLDPELLKKLDEQELDTMIALAGKMGLFSPAVVGQFADEGRVVAVQVAA
jgi:hypothetical protein